jgi:hypothetical protein
MGPLLLDRSIAARYPYPHDFPKSRKRKLSEDLPPLSRGRKAPESLPLAGERAVRGVPLLSERKLSEEPSTISRGKRVPESLSPPRGRGPQFEPRRCRRAAGEESGEARAEISEGAVSRAGRKIR